MLVRTEGIITQLVFEHALRIRMKAETDKSPVKLEEASRDSTVAGGTPDSASVEGSSSGDSRSGSGDETARSSAISIKSQGKQQAKAESDEDDKFNKDGTVKADNLVGKINNLVSVDLGNITEGRDFLILSSSFLHSTNLLILISRT